MLTNITNLSNIKSRSRSRSPIRVTDENTNKTNILVKKLNELENENSLYKEKIIKQNEEIDRVNLLVSSRERYHVDDKLNYTQKLYEYDSALRQQRNHTNMMLNKKKYIYQQNIKKLQDEISGLHTQINKLLEQQNSELVKQLVEQRVVALDTKVFEMMDNEKKYLEQEEKYKKDNAELEKYKELYNMLLKKKKLI